ncbi:CDP-glycerol glycerophosphotransferase family protein [Cryobacterium sp. TMT1-2-1]|uniref:CDP-glycerol glycerophosphotransferase family protein n=1 Tax=Cryobacterium sp. TMT1-2-1 TaxID=1259232 RepID=UPI00141AC4BF|nr:CDP-glycerol glycerophosphotransferase family protein [Cryobacterium sp. TMT1-2-1]
MLAEVLLPTPAPLDSETTTPMSTALVRGSFARRFVTAAGDGLLADLLAIAALCAALAGAWPWLTLTLATLGFAATIVFNLRFARELSRSVRPTGSFIIARTLVVFAVATVFAAGDVQWWPGWLAAAVLAGLVVGEGTAERVARGAIPFSAHLPGAGIRNTPLFSAGFIFPINALAIIVFAALAALGSPAGWLVLVALAAAVPTLAVLIDGVLRIRARRGAERVVTKVLQARKPVFAVHWDAPHGTEYQLAMWLPYLERLDASFFVIVRNQGTFDSVARLTTAPVLLRKEMADMDAMIVPSLKTVFYMNNAVRNSHFVRYPHLTHIQLNHGDSDKAPSYNPVFRMFDKNFVAGQAAIDRFASHGVHVPAEVFSIVGRPQVEGIAVGARAQAAPGAPTVLYAPTWAGHNADSDYSSLPIGYEIVRGLLTRNCTVIYRPHPYTDRNPAHAAQSERIKAMLRQDAAASSRAHIWGEAAERTLGITDCFNAADALVSDVSSVVPDFLYSEKPFAMAVMNVPVKRFLTDFPIAKAAYLIDSGLTSVDAGLDALIGPDPLRETRHALKTYYLGDIPADGYADAFLSEARRFLS